MQKSIVKIVTGLPFNFILKDCEYVPLINEIIIIQPEGYEIELQEDLLYKREVILNSIHSLFVQEGSLTFLPLFRTHTFSAEGQIVKLFIYEAENEQKDYRMNKKTHAMLDNVWEISK